MTTKKSNPELCLPSPHYFIVAGISLLSIQKELKPALPKRRQKESYVVVITAYTTSVRVAVAGGAVELPAISSGPFMVEVPYLLFEFVLTNPFEKGAVVKFELAAGSFSVNGMVTKSPDIVFQPGVLAPRPHSVAALATSKPPAAAAVTRVIANPLDATVGLPLLTAYAHLRKYGLQPHAASKIFAAQQVEVDGLLKKADQILGPVGITRADLERLLDRKVGLV